MSSPAKLTDMQLAILSEASKRKDRCLVAPKTLRGGAAQKIATKLLAAGLVREIKAKTGMEAWRRDEDTGQAYSLKLTDGGLKAIAATTSDWSAARTGAPRSTALLRPSHSPRNRDAIEPETLGAAAEALFGR